MKRPGDDSEDQHIPAVGLTTVVEPKDSSLDIVFVHGFTGHPERTWTHKRGAPVSCSHNGEEPKQPPPKTRRLNPFSSSRNDENHTAVYWPRDLLPSVAPDARILTFGYDTHIRHKLGEPVNKSTVYDIAWDFLVALEAERRHDPSRPLLFVVHSLGGIVVKETLRRSNGCRHGQSHLSVIFDATIGIMFFGTPHGGADPRGIFQHAAERVVKALGFSVNEQIVNTLLPSAERLRELRDEFGPMAQEQEWFVHSFQEQYGVKALGDNKVVEDTSSYLNIPSVEITEHIGRNHMDMCRFIGLEDAEFKKVNRALQRVMSKVSSRPAPTTQESLTDEQRSLLMESLKFEQIDARHMTIKKAHEKTCKWLLTNPQFLEWQDPTKTHEHHGFLWIKGKPGTGKSTIMKFAVGHAKRKMREKVIVSFFFNARGDSIEKSTTGAYRSILLQLFEKLPKLRTAFDTLGLLPGTISPNRQWTIESLKSLLEQVIYNLEDSVVCFIDALDECDEGQIRDMIRFFEHVGEQTVPACNKFQVCFSSRHYPHITIEKGLGLTLEGQEGHNQDMINYLHSELKIGRGQTAEKIREEVKEKASGVFMWVVLVVEILNIEYDGGRVHALKRRLQEIPGDLHELFRDILTRDTRNRDELILCLQWILFAARNLRPEELYFAIMAGIEPQNLCNWDRGEIQVLDIHRFILNASKGLVEITKSKEAKVQFIHESVNDFLLKENGLSKIWPELQDNFKGRSHEQLKVCCSSYAEIDIWEQLNISKELPKAQSPEAKALRNLVNEAFPLFEYAIQHVLYHSNNAEKNGVDQEHFIRHFQDSKLSTWIILENLFEIRQVRRHKDTTNLLYLLAEKNLSELIKHFPSGTSSLDIDKDTRYWSPFIAALALGNEDAVRQFLKAFATLHSPENSFHTWYKHYCAKNGSFTKLGRDYYPSDLREMILSLADHNDEALFFMLIETYQLCQLYQTPKISYKAILDKRPSHNKASALVMLIKRGKVANNSENVDNMLDTRICEREIWVPELLLDTYTLSCMQFRKMLDQVLGPSSKVSRSLLGPLSKKISSDYTPDVIHCTLKLGNDMALEFLYNAFCFWSFGKLQETNEGLSYPYCDAFINWLVMNSSMDDRMYCLFEAIRQAQTIVVQLMLKVGIDINSYYCTFHECLDTCKGSDVTTAVHEAVRYNRLEIIKILHEFGADVNFCDRLGRSPLWMAANHGSVSIVKHLIELGARTDIKNLGGHTAFSIALSWRRAEVLELLARNGAGDINSKNRHGETPLICAAERGDEKIVSSMIQLGAQVDLSSVTGRTALSYAAKAGNIRVMECLLEAGADVNFRDIHGETVLTHAVFATEYDATRVLLKYGADPNSLDSSGQSPFIKAAATGKHTSVELMLKLTQLDINHRNLYGRTALWLAAHYGDLPLTNLLLQAGADSEIADKYGVGPLAEAASEGHGDIVELLRTGLCPQLPDLN